MMRRLVVLTVDFLCHPSIFPLHMDVIIIMIIIRDAPIPVLGTGTDSDVEYSTSTRKIGADTTT